MDSLMTIQRYLIKQCRLSSYQLWHSINGLDFSRVFSYQFNDKTPSPTIQGNNTIIANSEYNETYFHYPGHSTIVLRTAGAKTLESSDVEHLTLLVDLYYLQLMLEREKHIRNKLIESIRDISILEDLDFLLTKILENALSVIPIADMGVLWMYDGDLGKLIPKAWAGGPSEEIKNMKMNIGEGIIGKTFQTNQSIRLTTMDDILRESATMSSENLQHLLNSYQFETVQSIISVPIKVEEQTLCVLIIYQNGLTSLLTKEDQQLLESFSDQVSIALKNSKLFHDLKKHNQLLVQRDRIHDTFIKISLQSKGLKFIVNELFKLIHKPLIIFDFSEDQLFSSPGEWLSEFPNELKRIITHCQDPSFHFLQVSGQEKLLYIHPIIAIDVPFGLIIVEVNEGDLLPLDKMILEQASSIIALEMIRKHTLTESYYQKTHDLFHDFLQCKENYLLTQKAVELGLDLASNNLVILIHIPSHMDIQFTHIQVHKLISLIKERFHDYTPIIFGYRNKITMLCQFSTHSQKNYLLSNLKNIQTSWKYLYEGDIKIGVGSSYQELNSIQKSYTEADKAITYLVSKRLTGIMNFEEIGINRLFINHPNEELNAFINEVFLPLQTENDQSLMLEQTLLVYMENDRTPGKTAQLLHIHVNTLYKRLKKIEEILNISLTDTEDILKLQLACYLRKTSNSI
ncbi:diguanylate phosphodiesterase [Bacillus sp. AFS076308]|uniref:helix-turn-helix domain-containing protein n=1 Tax=unclassified Bacillus (in: firmicutes) TaxID=185979 RepID=UPI000BF2CE53|nr:MULTISPECIES: helix-turn-helix domain-containing protein [unclassified Bacillus (in: firmicutes)]PFO07405.1 diguanylate phosphodiesterase [Bacillus sp. AFS076308]PGV52032.1 diguanylate phosphodiesterase [Bacillus sp. AFS037270]